MSLVDISHLNVQQEIKDEDVNAFFVWIQQTMFRGFDPLVTRAEFQREGGNSWKRDLLAIFAIYSNKGTKLTDDKISRTSEEGKTVINTLITKYKLKKDIASKARDLQPKDITIQRLISAYAHVYAYVLARVPESSVRQVGGTASGLPHYLRFPQSISLIPADSPLNSAYDNWNASFNEIINSNIKTTDPERDALRRKQFKNVMQNSPLYSYEFRKTHLTTLAMIAQIPTANLTLIKTTPPSSVNNSNEGSSSAITSSPGSNTAVDEDEKKKTVSSGSKQNIASMFNKDKEKS